MRVIAGSAKGRRLKSPKGRGIRPTSDRVREAIFSAIASEIAGRKVLDLCAGTGALGIEALSRGASEAIFIDESRAATALISENLGLSGFADRATIIADRVERAVDRLAKEDIAIGLIFLDPPYRMSVTVISNICVKVTAGLLADGGLMILEHSAKLEAPMVARARIIGTKRYGDTAVTIYRKEGAGEGSDLSG